MTEKDYQRLAADLRTVLDELPRKSEDLAGIRGKRLREELEKLAAELRSRLMLLDPTRHPDSFFDPADPRLFGVFAALALIGQERKPLASVAANKFYGSGVYAIYYKGPFKTYSKISGTEHPIYVGKADPAEPDARSPREQGDRLCGRLNEHRKNIERAKNLDIADFDCRHLVVATGWQTAAESALIGLFRPIWNKEVGILLGFGKHGDSAETRRNTRSPWDVLHAGREWAASDIIADRTPSEQIEQDVDVHFGFHPPVVDIQHIFEKLMWRVRTPPP